MRLFEENSAFFHPRRKKKEDPFDYKADNLLDNSCLKNFYLNQAPDIRKKIHANVESMISESDYTDNGNFGHLSNLFSAISVYKVLSANGRTKEDVLNEIATIFYERAEEQHESNKRIAKLPGFIRMMKKQFPVIIPKNNGKGWDIELPECGKTEFAFIMKSCIYVTICQDYGCPEMTPIFCHLDQIIYRDLPTVEFIQTGTIYEGASQCDFRFVKHE